MDPSECKRPCWCLTAGEDRQGKNKTTTKWDVECELLTENYCHW